MTISSCIESIYNAIADYAVPIASRGVNLTARRPADMPQTIPSADLPIRLLLSFSVGSGNSSGQAVHLGTAPWSQVTWTITDMMLFAPAQGGIGLAEFVPVLLEYAAAYVDLPRTLRSPVEGKSTILTNYSIQPNVYEYPQFSNNWYFGVMCELTYTENLGAA